MTLLSHDIGFSDHWHFHVSLKHLLAESLSRGELPWWSPQISLGFPLLRRARSERFIRPLAPVWNSAVDGRDGVLGMHLVLAGAGVALLAREGGRTPQAAAMAGSSITSGFLICRARHLNMVEAAAWVPWMILGVWRVVTGKSNGVGFGAALTLCVLAGHPQIAYIGILTSGVLAGVLLPWSKGSSAWGPPLLRGVAAGAAALLLSSPQWLHTLELSSLSSRGGGLSWEEANQWSYPLSLLWMFVQPGAYGDPADLATGGFQVPGGGEAFFWEVNGYMGMLGLLGFGTAFLFKKGMERRILVTLAGLGLFFLLAPALGMGAVLHEILPGYNRFRFQSRWLLLMNLTGALGAAVLADLLVGRLRALKPLQRRAVWCILLLIPLADNYGALGHRIQ